MKFAALFLSIYLFMGSLFPLMDFSQLAKMVNLWQHYKLHQAEIAEGGESLSFASFWIKHYVDDDPHSHPDDNGHQSLPLTQISCGACFLLSQHYFPKFNFSHIFSDQHVEDDILPSFDLSQSLFRPPIV